MSIKKQSIMLLAGLAAVVSISSVNAFEARNVEASAFAKEQASAVFNSALSKGDDYTPCSFAGVTPTGKQQVEINLSGANLGANVIVDYGQFLEFDMLFLAGLNCTGKVVAPSTQ